MSEPLSTSLDTHAPRHGAPLGAPRLDGFGQTRELHVAQVNFYLDPHARAADALLAAWPSLVMTAEAAHAAGVRVTVLQAHHERARCARQGITYEFLPPTAGPVWAALLTALRVDVLHVHGLGFARDAARLCAAQPRLPLLLQDHAARRPRPWHWPRWRRDLSVADGIAFCAAEQARPFRAAGLIGAASQVFEIVECSSRFTPGPAAAARAATGLYGAPALLWIGHLDHNKDPLSVLVAVSALVPEHPGLQLWCAFGSAPLERAVRRCIAGDARLRGRVHLLGARPHGEVQALMRASDLFVLGSHREGSGYAVLESLACGLPPVITDIPSFRMLTGGGTVGALWSPGNPGSCVAALRRALTRTSAAERERTRGHFERELSMAAFGLRLRSAYDSLFAAGVRAPRAAMA